MSIPRTSLHTVIAQGVPYDKDFFPEEWADASVGVVQGNSFVIYRNGEAIVCSRDTREEADTFREQVLRLMAGGPLTLPGQVTLQVNTPLALSFPRLTPRVPGQERALALKGAVVLTEQDYERLVRRSFPWWAFWRRKERLRHFMVQCLFHLTDGEEQEP